MKVQPPTWAQWQSEQIWIRVRWNVVDLLIHKNKQILTRTNCGTVMRAWKVTDPTLVMAPWSFIHLEMIIDDTAWKCRSVVQVSSKYEWIHFFHRNWMMLNSDFLPLLHFCCRPLFFGGKIAKSVERCIAAVIFELTIDLEPNWPIWTSHPC